MNSKNVLNEAERRSLERYLNEHYYHLIVEYMFIALVKKKIDVNNIREMVNLVLENYRNYQLIMEDNND